MKGRKPKPERIKQMEGSRRAGSNPHEVTPLAGVPDPPSHLDRTAKTEFRRMAKLLDDMGCLAIIDGSILAAYAQTYSHWRQAEQTLQKEGLYVESKSGWKAKHPALSVAQYSIDQMRRLLNEMGLTAANRARLVNLRASEEDDATVNKWSGLVVGL